MKILYMTISYNLEANGLYQNLVEALLNRGHEVTLVRSKADALEDELKTISKQFKVLSIKTADPFSSNLIKKGLNQIMLASYFKRAILKFLKDEEFDLVLYATPPVTLASVVKFCKVHYNAKTFLMLKDIFPQNAVDLDMMKKGGPIYRYFRKQEKKYYKISDVIGCMSKGNKEYLLKHNPEVSDEKVCIFPNSIKIEEVDGLKFNNDKTVFLFGGSLGKPQNIMGLLCIIDQMKLYSKAEFMIIGDGTERNIITSFIETYDGKNLIYKKKMPQEDYEKILRSADVGIISLDPRFTIPNIPSRMQTYMKLKKPILAITDNNTDLKDIIQDNNCGWWCDYLEINNVVSLIKQICENKEEQILKGVNGFNVLCSDYNVEHNVEQIEDFLKII